MVCWAIIWHPCLAHIYKQTFTGCWNDGDDYLQGSILEHLCILVIHHSLTLVLYLFAQTFDISNYCFRSSYYIMPSTPHVFCNMLFTEMAYKMFATCSTRGASVSTQYYFSIYSQHYRSLMRTSRVMFLRASACLWTASKTYAIWSRLLKMPTKRSNWYVMDLIAAATAVGSSYDDGGDVVKVLLRLLISQTSCAWR